MDGCLSSHQLCLRVSVSPCVCLAGWPCVWLAACVVGDATRDDPPARVSPEYPAGDDATARRTVFLHLCPLFVSDADESRVRSAIQLRRNRSWSRMIYEALVLMYYTNAK